MKECGSDEGEYRSDTIWAVGVRFGGISVRVLQWAAFDCRKKIPLF